MPETTSIKSLRNRLSEINIDDADYAIRFVDTMLAGCEELGGSDIHLLPQEKTLMVKLRLDGILHPLGIFPRGTDSDVIMRLKVMAELHIDAVNVPLEGRFTASGKLTQMRLSTFPTMHGERAVVRLLTVQKSFERLDGLGISADVRQQLNQILAETSGAIVIAGPAGAGKTTTAYAMLREIAHQSEGSKSLFSLENPIEAVIPLVAQSRVTTEGPLTFAVGIRALLRQDPEVIYVGEMRDEATARIAMQVALTGHLLITTFHAGRAAAVISRLSEMGLEPYVLRSGIRAVLCQWLVRKLCQCAEEGTAEHQKLGLEVERWWTSVGCDRCNGSGYRGRMLISEFLPIDDKLGREIFHQHDAASIESLAIAQGMLTRWQHAADAVQAGHTSPEEVRRVLGLEHVSKLH